MKHTTVKTIGKLFMLSYAIIVLLCALLWWSGFLSQIVDDMGYVGFVAKHRDCIRFCIVLSLLSLVAVGVLFDHFKKKAKSLEIMSMMALPADVTDVKYYIQRRDEKHCAIFRMLKRTSWGEGESWSWQKNQWIENKDVERRYWNGFDADVDDATQEEVVRAIQAITTGGSV
jgi:hypothetical protein